jgi:hypothetical protein
MDRRKSKRIPYFLDGRMILGTDSYNGSIEDVSTNGIEYMVVFEKGSLNNIAPHNIIELNFQVPSVDKIKLQCEIVWIYRSPNIDKAMVLGLEIFKTPLKYKKFIDNIEEECLNVIISN